MKFDTTRADGTIYSVYVDTPTEAPLYAKLVEIEEKLDQILMTLRNEVGSDRHLG